MYSDLGTILLIFISILMLSSHLSFSLSIRTSLQLSSVFLYPVTQMNANPIGRVI